jgi:hypothetical protein
MPAETPVEMPAETTVEMPAETTVEMPAETTAEMPAETTAEMPAETTAEMLLLLLPERLKPLVDSLRSHESTPICFSVPGAGIATGPHRGALSGSRH